MNDFAVFILSHGRANKVVTYKSLRRAGYSGKIYIIVDNEDKQIEEYKKNYGEQVIVFDKQKQLEITETMDNFGTKQTVLFARNVNFQIAKELGIQYFLQLDDDYGSWESTFSYKAEERDGYLITFNHKQIKNLDKIFEEILKFFKNTPIRALALAQRGDFVGGKDNVKSTITALRKCMNTWFLKTNEPIEFIGTMNDDYNTSLLYSSRGAIFLTLTQITIGHNPTQTTEGGITELYKRQGTYVKTFYSVMLMPSAVKVSVLGSTYPRIHHKAYWDLIAPKIIREEYKK